MSGTGSPGREAARTLSVVVRDFTDPSLRAHGRMTGIALTSIPLGVAVIMFYVNPDYVKFFFTDDVGHLMAGAAVLLQIIGYLIIQHIVKIEV